MRYASYNRGRDRDDYDRLLVVLTRHESTRGQKWRQLRGWRLSAIQITKMATSRGSIPVTFGTFEALVGRCGIKNHDSYEDGDLKGLHPCDCWHF